MAAPVYPVFNLPPWFRPQGGNKEGTGAQQQEKGEEKGRRRRAAAARGRRSRTMSPWTSRSSTAPYDSSPCALPSSRCHPCSAPVGSNNARVTWSDPVAAETREVPDAAAHPFDRKLVSTQRLVKE
ncbi:hypothetical protein ZWY2020_010953 [Hordeum vulgare]|nr:hypothetical protein ZWY2020_010953 [Hordeum vulgare]